MISVPTDGPMQREEFAASSEGQGMFRPAPLLWLIALLFKRKHHAAPVAEPFEDHIDGLA